MNSSKPEKHHVDWRHFQEKGDTSLAFLSDVTLELRAEFGRKCLSIGELVRLKRVSIIPLDRELDAEIDLYLHGNCIGKGEVVVINDSYGVRVTSIKDPNG